MEKWQFFILNDNILPGAMSQYPPLQPGVVPAVRLSSSDDEAVTPTTQPLVSEKFARIFASFYFYCFVAVKFFIIFAPR